MTIKPFVIAFLALLLATDYCHSADEQRPNIVLIMADDLGIEGLGCYGGLSYATPNLDGLAGTGVRFTHAYAQPLCTNTRLQLMTGLHNNRNWKSFGILDPKSKTIGHYFKEAGYKSCMAGKWQLQSYDPPDYPGGKERRGTGMHPKDTGFDHYSLFHSLHTEDKGSRYADPTWLEDGELKSDSGGYGPDHWVEFINEFMERERDNPFFVYYPMALPHWPMNPTPESTEWQDPSKRLDEDGRYFKDMVEYMDKCVGRIVSKIDDLGIRENTLIVFYSDNGTHLTITSQTTWGEVAGGKGLTTDAGTHVPLIASWPGKIEPAVSDALVDSTDFIPTLLEAAKSPLPAEHKLDGISFYPVLTGESSSTPDREWVYCFYDPRPGWDKDQFSRQVFARDRRWKLYEDGRLIDISNDRLEQHPIAESNQADEAIEARNRLARVLEDQSQPVSTAKAEDVFLDVFLGQGTMSGEVTSTSALLQTRLTAAMELNEAGDLPGVAGVASFEWGTNRDFVDCQQTAMQHAEAGNDYVVREQLDNLKPGTRYYYRAVHGSSEQSLMHGTTCSFQTLPGEKSSQNLRFVVGSCMNYNKFMHGKRGRAGGPLTATEEDKRLGFPAFASMKSLKPDFFVGTGDIVYYDNAKRVSETVLQLRRCWHEQFRFPRMIDFFQDVPCYWSKDDHDFRYNDSDNSSDRLPLSKTGIDLFHEQLPIAAMNAPDRKTYRTHRLNQDLQIWLTEGRDFRSPNLKKDGPEKSLWGAEQLAWLQRTLKDSDAKWKILITPTPMVGPDDARKKDNHANLGGFRHEANAFFQWINDNEIKNFMTVCGDRHWQYHSIHPSGVEEFACGALNDENSRKGILPGDRKGTDPEAKIRQPFISPKSSGGFLMIEASSQLNMTIYDDEGNPLYSTTKS